MGWYRALLVEWCARKKKFLGHRLVLSEKLKIHSGVLFLSAPISKEFSCVVYFIWMWKYWNRFVCAVFVCIMSNWMHWVHGAVWLLLAVISGAEFTIIITIIIATDSINSFRSAVRECNFINLASIHTKREKIDSVYQLDGVVDAAVNLHGKTIIYTRNNLIHEASGTCLIFPEKFHWIGSLDSTNNTLIHMIWQRKLYQSHQIKSMHLMNNMGVCSPVQNANYIVRFAADFNLKLF